MILSVNGANMTEKNSNTAKNLNTKISNEVFNNPRKGGEKLYKEVYIQLVAKNSSFAKLAMEGQVEKMGAVNLAYELAKTAHRQQTRISGERYFNHIKSVATILITEFPTISLEQVIAALLHDVVEDSPITMQTIENIFGSRVAYMVDAVTKKPDEYYLWPDEKDMYYALSGSEQKEFLKSKKASIKQRRTDHYFGHMADLDTETLQVKFADRIHNLRDLTHCTVSKIKDQLTETETYILPIAYNKNIVAYNLMKKELEKLHKQVYGNTSKFKEYLATVL